MNKYFDKGLTAEQLHERYKQLAKKLHPDAGGTNEEFSAMQEEYEQRLNDLLDEKDFQKDSDKRTRNEEQYILAMKFLLELTKMKKPKLHNKVVTIADAACQILDVFETDETDKFSRLIKRITSI